MDVAIVLKVLDTSLKLADSSLVKEIFSSWSYKSELEKIEETMRTITSVLLDAEEQEWHSMLNMDREWFDNLRDAVNEANILFDKVATIAYRKQLQPGGKWVKEVFLFFSFHNQLDFASTMSHEAKKLSKRLNHIASNRCGFAAQSCRSLGNRTMMSKRRKDSHSMLLLGPVIGRENAKKEVTDLLLVSSANEDFYFVSIVGIGGLGKTTLAQYIYNDNEITSKFTLRLWVCVSDYYDFETILRKLLQSVKPENYNHFDVNILVSLVQKYILDTEKFLLVLDDVWNEKHEDLVELRNFLTKGIKGSRIIVTTRSKTIAKNIGDVTYELESLSDSCSWELFKKVAFDTPDQMNMNLDEIGREIVTKCAKVPLVIKAVGSLLNNQGERKWRSFRDHDLGKIMPGDQSDSITTVLKYSYDNLTAPLKRCFSFCAIFPKDYRIDKNTLISMWMAHGFIKPEGDSSVEDTGEEYFMTLFLRCFFHDIEIDELGEITSCKIHDLMHDVAKTVTIKDILVVNSNNATHVSQLEINARHLSLGNIGIDSFADPLGKMRHLHTIFLSGQMRGAFELPLRIGEKLLSKASFLRSLSLCHMSIISLPSGPIPINKLYHLRHLDLSNDQELVRLPEAVSSLMNLQTLKLKNCKKLTKLPADLCKLVHLRELDILGCDKLTHMPEEFNKLTCLRRLSMFVAKYNPSGSSVGGKLQDLEALTNLMGSLKIGVTYGSNIFHWSSKYFSSGSHIVPLGSKYIKGLENLNELSVFNTSKSLLEALQPHRNIKSFHVFNYFGSNSFPDWGSSSDLEKSLPNVVKFSLDYCNILQHIPSLGRLRYLKVLKLNDIHNLKYIEEGQEGMNEKSQFFPVLETLQLVRLNNLETWHRVSSTPQKLYPVSHCFHRLSSMNINHTELTSIPLSAKVKILKLICVRLQATLKFDCEQWRTGVLFLRLVVVRGEHKSLSQVVDDSFWRRLSTLERLDIINWHNLRSLNEPWVQHLTSLRDLRLRDLQEFELAEDDMPWESLTNLCNLQLQNLPKLVNLPQGIKHLTSLKSLDILQCHNLTLLPQVVLDLPSLTTLAMKNCQGLNEKYQPSNEADWSTIQHIPQDLECQFSDTDHQVCSSSLQ